MIAPYIYTIAFVIQVDRTYKTIALKTIHSLSPRHSVDRYYKKIALAIHSLDPTKAGAQCAPYIHTIAFVIHSVDRSRTLQTRGRISIALAIHSLDRTLEEINPKGWCAVRTLHIAIALAIHSLDRSVDPAYNNP